MKNQRNRRGFSLIELIIVVAILGILAVLALPNLLGAMDKSRQTSTLNNMRTIGQALERYAIDHKSRYPTGDSLEKLTAKLVPEYVKELPLEDGWDYPMQYTISETRASFTLRAVGKDGLPQVDGTTDDQIDIFERDIIMIDGAFAQRPGDEDDENDEDDTQAAA